MEFFNQGSANDFLDVNPGASTRGTGGNPFGIFSDIYSGRGIFNGSRRTAPKQTGYDSGSVEQSPTTFTVGGVTYDKTTRQAINPGTNEVAPGGYSIDTKSGKRTDAARPSIDPPARSSGPAGSETRTNNNNVTQTGRNLSAISMPRIGRI